MTTTGEVRLDIEGMTCASCAVRIEKRLNKLDGVTASVNYATEQADVTFADGISTDVLIAQVEAAGYHASVPGPPTDVAAPDIDPTRSTGYRQPRNRFGEPDIRSTGRDRVEHCPR